MTDAVSPASAKRRRPRSFSTRGDTGYTSLLGGKKDPVNKYRVPKYHPQPETYGTLDEAGAALSLSHASTSNKRVKEIVSLLKADFCLLMAELATAPEAYAASSYKITGEHVRRLEGLIQELQKDVELPTVFVSCTRSFPAATLELARTIVRRAERHAAKLRHDHIISNDEVLRYINRCGDLLWTLVRYEEATGDKAGIQDLRP